MTKSLWFQIGWIGIIGICPLRAQANLLTNGGFEDGALGRLGAVSIPAWNSWGNSGWHHSDTGACLGTKGMKFWWDDSGLWQDFAAAEGLTYSCRVQVMDWSNDTSSNNWDLRIEAEFYNAAHTAIVKEVLGYFDSSSQPDDTWIEVGGTITAPPGTAYGRVVLRLWDWKSGISGALYFDNVSVTILKNADYNNDFYVNYEDYLQLSRFWGQTAPQYDLNEDDRIDISDLAIFVQDWMVWQEPADVKIVSIDPAVTYQEIEGFGASLTDSSAWLIYEFLTPSERQAVLTDLFDPQTGIGLNYLRQPMGSSDFRLQDYSYDDLPPNVNSDYALVYFSIAYDENYIIPTLQEILSINPAVRIMASPWSPPVWMKISGQIGGGRLKNDVYTTYANYFVKYIQAYAAHGISIDAVTLQNEPYYEPWTYPGCRMEPADQIKLVKEMGPAFQQHQIATKILIWDHNWDNPDYPLTVLSDPLARPYISGTAFHHYGGDVSAQTLVHNAYPDKAVYFTEGSDGTWNDGGFEADLVRNGVFLVDTVRNWAKTLIKWNLILDENNGPKIAGGCDTCYGVITIHRSTRQITPRPQYYALGHAAKFLKRGAVRIHSQSDDIPTAAFQNPDGMMVLYVVNPDAIASILKLQWNGQWLLTRLPPRSILTCRWASTGSAKVDRWLTTGDQQSLLEALPPLFFHD